MAKLIIDSSTMTGIADAVRSKEGSTDAILFADIASKILALKGGGGGTIYTGTSLFTAAGHSSRIVTGLSVTGDELIFILCNEAKTLNITGSGDWYYPLAMLRIPSHMTSDNKVYTAQIGALTSKSKRKFICVNYGISNYFSGGDVWVDYPYECAGAACRWMIYQGA